MTEEIESPPFPSEGLDPRGLYLVLRQLHTWVAKNRDKHNKLVGKEAIGVADALPSCESYVCQPVLSLYGHWKLIRQFREAWDATVRNFENDWDNKACVRERVVVLLSALILLNNAFVPYEYKETLRDREFEKMQKEIDMAIRSLNVK